MGFTTTIPVEVVYAAGAEPVDLNNLFVTHPDRQKFLSRAELDGYPRNLCPWIKGIYGAVLAEGIEEVIAVMQGDCSNTHALAETLEMHGVRIIPFSYPYDGDAELLRKQIERLAEALGVASWSEVLSWKRRLDEIRRLLRKLDELTWRDGKVTGFENHIWLVSASDFGGDPDAFAQKLESFLGEVSRREPMPQKVRLGYIGVPPMFGDIYDVVEEYGARVVFNEVQRQFAMLDVQDDIVEQYRRYTYPYKIGGRIADIRGQIERRRLAGIIHYTESFCFRRIEDLIFRRELSVPIITVEGGESFSVDSRTKMRLQAFCEMLVAGVR